MKRADGRRPDEERQTSFEMEWCPGAAAGSCLVRGGRTVVLVRATLEDGVPRWRTGQGAGWITAEYAMLPAATSSRRAREGRKGQGVDGRSVEIQRLIGRSLRASCDLPAFGERTLTVDCDVLQADGGTRTLSFNAAVAALGQVFANLQRGGVLARSPFRLEPVAVSVALVDGELLVDPTHPEDSAASADMTLILGESGEIVEVQASGEKEGFDRSTLDAALGLAIPVAGRIAAARRSALEGVA